MTPKSESARFIARQEAAQRKHDLLTNAIVNLSLHQPPRVNGKPLKLSTHGHTLLMLLASRAVEFPGDFLPTDHIVSAIERGRRVLGELRMSWNAPTNGQVHAAVSNLRRALRKAHVPDLLESVKDKGYRLSTPSMNIVVNVPGVQSWAGVSLDAFLRSGRGELPDGRRPCSS